MVHVVQWERLGIDNFLLAYGTGLLQYGFRDSPLEEMAYSLQSGFESGSLSMDTVEIIQQQTDAVWDVVSTNLSAV